MIHVLFAFTGSSLMPSPRTHMPESDTQLCHQNAGPFAPSNGPDPFAPLKHTLQVG